jgi:hypothetical protein
MLQLLLDEQISPDVADGLRKASRGITVRWMAEWESGRFMGLPDHLLLEEAAAQKLTLVTYDRKTIPPLLKRWIEEGRNHGGMIFVDGKTIRSSDFGALIRGLQTLWIEARDWDWKDRIIVLRK